jgi:DNA-binding beta-propeller fold protein YncE
LVCVKRRNRHEGDPHQADGGNRADGIGLIAGSIDDVFGQSVPSVSTYASGLTNPRGLAFGPDGNLYVAEAGTGGSQTPADIDPSCPLMVNVFSPFTAGYSGRVTRVRADGTKETVADNLPSVTDSPASA